MKPHTVSELGAEQAGTICISAETVNVNYIVVHAPERKSVLGELSKVVPFIGLAVQLFNL